MVVDGIAVDGIAVDGTAIIDSESWSARSASGRTCRVLGRRRSISGWGVSACYLFSCRVQNERRAVRWLLCVKYPLARQPRASDLIDLKKPSNPALSRQPHQDSFH
jgi:hypothetical protein